MVNGSFLLVCVVVYDGEKRVGCATGKPVSLHKRVATSKKTYGQKTAKESGV